MHDTIDNKQIKYGTILIMLIEIHDVIALKMALHRPKVKGREGAGVTTKV